jgi:hypothetical protein
MLSSRLASLLKRPAVLLAACATLLAGCGALDRWEPSNQWKDPPFAHGAKAKPMSRWHSCAFCPNGHSVESAFFADGRAFYLEPVGEQAGQLVLKSSGANWTVLDKEYDGTDRLFAPIRIIAASLEPLVVMTVPWTYESATRQGRGNPRSGDEIRSFMETENWAGPNTRYIAQAWPKGLRPAVEFRGSLPKEATTVRLMSKKSVLDVALPQAGARTTVVFDGKPVTFARSEGGVVAFDFSKN